MKDRSVRKSVKAVLATGIVIVSALSIAALILGGVWGNIAVGALLLLPISRLLTEVVAFTKEGKARYALISVILILMIASSFTFALLQR